jgi:hypothetical protein
MDGLENNYQIFLYLLWGASLLLLVLIAYVWYKWSKLKEKVAQPGFYDDLLQKCPIPLFLQKMKMNTDGKLKPGEIVIWNDAIKILFNEKDPSRFYNIMKTEAYYLFTKHVRRAFLQRNAVRYNQIVYLRSGIAIDASLYLKSITFRGQKYVVGTFLDLQTVMQTVESEMFSLQDRENFIRDLSHEVRIPMNDIIGFTELLLGEEDEKKRKEYSDIIYKKSLELSDLICQISDRDTLYKMEGGNV